MRFYCRQAGSIEYSSGKGKPAEFMGRYLGAGDRTSLISGTLIVDEDSWIGCGGLACIYTLPKTTLILLQGAGGGYPHGSTPHGQASFGIGGTIRFGTPELPFTRDWELPLLGLKRDQINGGTKPEERTAGASFVLGEQGRLEVHRKGTAKLIFLRQQPEWETKEHQNNQALNKPKEDFAGTRLAFAFHGEALLEGVEFRDCFAGGIFVKPEVKARWKSVEYGSGNEGATPALFAAVP